MNLDFSMDCRRCTRYIYRYTSLSLFLGATVYTCICVYLYRASGSFGFVERKKKENNNSAIYIYIYPLDVRCVPDFSIVKMSLRVIVRELQYYMQSTWL